MKGELGLQKDSVKAMELFLKATEHGCPEAYYNMGNLYRNGDGVEKNMKKAIHCYQLGTIGGCLSSRHNLACLDCNYERAYKHLLICTKAGLELSVKTLQVGVEDGYVTNDEYEEALKAYQNQHEETKSVMRDEALAFESNFDPSFLEDLRRFANMMC